MGVVTLHVVSSIDGFIARKDNCVSWLENPGDVYEAGIAEDSAEAQQVLSDIDCYVLGSRTYEHVLELGWPYGDKPVVVVTGRRFEKARTTVEFYSGDLARLVSDVLAPRYPNIWLAGGAALCRSFLRDGLVDRLVLSIAPVMLGDGLRLFAAGEVEQRWELKDVVAYKSGFVELSYGVARAE